MTATVGDNSDTVRPDELRSFVERVESLLAERADLSEDVKTVMSEAEGAGYDKKTIRKVIKLRAMERADRQEQELLLQMYCKALGIE